MTTSTCRRSLPNRCHVVPRRCHGARRGSERWGTPAGARGSARGSFVIPAGEARSLRLRPKESCRDVTCDARPTDGRPWDKFGTSLGQVRLNQPHATLLDDRASIERQAAYSRETACFQGLGTLWPLALLAQLVEHLHGKEGVGGSSPPEGSAKVPQIASFSFGSACTFSSVHWVWSRLWSFQIRTALGKPAFFVSCELRWGADDDRPSFQRRWRSAPGSRSSR
jgi:hypothetical protein